MQKLLKALRNSLLFPFIQVSPAFETPSPFSPFSLSQELQKDSGSRILCTLYSHPHALKALYSELQERRELPFASEPNHTVYSAWQYQFPQGMAHNGHNKFTDQNRHVSAHGQEPSHNPALPPWLSHKPQQRLRALACQIPP